ncbi:MAG TPA: flagellar hook-length control protein FliK [Anaerolineaceae bacterium]
MNDHALLIGANAPPVDTQAATVSTHKPLKMPDNRHFKDALRSASSSNHAERTQPKRSERIEKEKPKEVDQNYNEVQSERTSDEKQEESNPVASPQNELAKPAIKEITMPGMELQGSALIIGDEDTQPVDLAVNTDTDQVKPASSQVIETANLTQKDDDSQSTISVNTTPTDVEDQLETETSKGNSEVQPEKETPVRARPALEHLPEQAKAIGLRRETSDILPPGLANGHGAGFHHIETIPAPPISIEPDRLAEAQRSNVIQQITPNIELLVKRGDNTMRVQLYPQDLGKVEIVVTNKNGSTEVTLFADQPGTTRLLESDLSRLRQTLIDSGVQLSNLLVGQQHHPSQQEGFEGWRHGSHRRNGAGFSIAASGEDESEGVSVRSILLGVDYKV